MAMADVAVAALHEGFVAPLYLRKIFHALSDAGLKRIAKRQAAAGKTCNAAFGTQRSDARWIGLCAEHTEARCVRRMKLKHAFEPGTGSEQRDGRGFV